MIGDSQIGKCSWRICFRQKQTPSKKKFRSRRREGETDQYDGTYIYDSGHFESEEEEYQEAIFSLKDQKKVEIPKKCQRPDACYIMSVCLYCKPFWKKYL